MEQEQPQQPQVKEPVAAPDSAQAVRRRTINIVFLGLCTVVALGVYVSYLLSNQFNLLTQPVIEQKLNEGYVTEEERDVWNTYSDAEYSFTIKYPQAWEYRVEDNQENKLRTIFFFNKEEEGAPQRGVIVNVVAQEEMVKKLREGAAMTLVGAIEDVKSLNLFGDSAALQKEAFLSETNIYNFSGEYAFNFRLDLAPEESLTQELKTVYDEVFNEMVNSFAYTENVAKKECRKTGCSGQICSDEEVTTTCEYSDVFACYEGAVCEKQPSGECGWTLTDDLKACLKSAAGVIGK